MTLKSFDVSLRKGAVGEDICRRHLEGSGWVVYQPLTEGAHAFDMLAIKNKRQAIAIDIKAKSRLNKWAATGINQSHFETYAAFSNKHSMPFWLLFVDEGERRIYGNSLEKLEAGTYADGRHWPWQPEWNPKIRLWHLSQMQDIAELDGVVADSLAGLSQRSYTFAPTIKGIA